ncbi:hypothetical protein CPC08DRAFT_649764 [Agrocybe pediades]|nr:hypothetical protein CPC08DRAFT_649764 [Agrocybe pediades]
MGFWYPSTKTAFASPMPVSLADNIIFYFESLTVYCALLDVARTCNSGDRIVIYTDNLNTVHMFNSLSCPPSFNPLLRAAVDVIIEQQLHLRVLHIAGADNTVADALSRVRFDIALELVPDLTINAFLPPPWTLGAVEL